MRIVGNDNISRNMRKLKNKGVPKVEVTNACAGAAVNACCDKWIWSFLLRTTKFDMDMRQGAVNGHRELSVGVLYGVEDVDGEHKRFICRTGS